MEKQEISHISISEAKKVYNGPYINDDLLLFNEIGEIPLPKEPRRTKCILMALCLKGSAGYTVNTEQRTVRANDVIIISEDQLIDKASTSSDLSGIGLMLSHDFFSEVMKGIHDMSSLFLFSRSHPVFNLPADMVHNIITYFDMIKEKVDNQSHHFRTDIVRSLIAAMLYDISHVIYINQLLTTKKQTRAEAIFTEFIHLVEQNFRQERRVSWYGEQLRITPKYLSETVKQVSNRTPNEWIDNYVTLELRVQLKNTTRSIKEIAKELSFPNQSFLGKYFKEHVGISPSEYRKS